MIQELEEETQVGKTERELIKDLSLKYNIISRFTSFIGVDEEGSEKKKEVGEMLVRRVDNMIPHRFGGRGHGGIGLGPGGGLRSPLACRQANSKQRPKELTCQLYSTQYDCMIE